MKLSALALPACLPACLIALGFGLSTADRIEFAPAEDLRQEKTVEVRMELSLDDFSAVVMGQEIDPSMAGNPEFELVYEQKVVLADHFRKVGDGRPLELERSFVELGAEQHFAVEAETESESMDMTLSSELEGKDVVFTWDAEAEEYSVAFAEDQDGDEELLAGLEEDVDLRALLPGRPVSPGDEWQLDPASLSLILAPGGNVHLVPEDMGDLELPPEFLELTSGLEENVREMMDELFAGSATATYVGRREQEGLELAEISLDMDIESSLDLVDLLEEVFSRIAEIEPDADVDVEIELATVDFTWEADGTLLWDLGAGHFRSFDLGGELSIVIEVAISGEEAGETMEFEVMVEMSGPTSFSASSE